MIYPTTIGGDIGSLLRLIQEEKARQFGMGRPGAAPGEQVREIVQQPLMAPEAPGTARVVGIKPEAVVGPQTPVSPTAPVPQRMAVGPVRVGGVPAGQVIRPLAPQPRIEAAAPGVSAPSGPSEPSRPSEPSGPSGPSAPAPVPTPRRAVTPSPPSLGTKIVSQPARPTPTPAPVDTRVQQIEQKYAGQIWSPQEEERQWRIAQQAASNLAAQVASRSAAAKKQQAAVANIPLPQRTQVYKAPSVSLGTAIKSWVKGIFGRR